MSYEIKDIPGFPDYRADSDGQIWSQKRWGKWKILKPFLNPAGRPLVSVWNTMNNRKVVHPYCLVLAAFVGPRPSGMEACHNDGNALNNRPDNLRWDTKKNNEADKAIHGTKNIGVRNGRAKIGPKQVNQIRIMLEDGLSQKEIARRIGICQASVSHISTGALWKHV